jgi:hypothetical protein
MADHREFLEMSVTLQGLNEAFFAALITMSCVILAWLPVAIVNAI